jgi:tRNA(Ile)-lysidine synthase
VDKQEALEHLEAAVRDSGLLPDRGSVVVLTSGGADSACAAAGATRALGPERVHALHLNYGLRPTATRDERTCRSLCANLRIDLHVERPELAEGNVQAAARRARYDAAERLRDRTSSEAIVTGHSRTDLAETLIYRLAASPGSRALLGLAPQNGRVVRPLLRLERERLRELARAAGLPFADDETNLDPSYARNRIRNEVLPVLADLSPASQRNVAETQAELREEAELLERVVLEALEEAGSKAGDVSVPAAALEPWGPGLRRLALRALAERAAGRKVALGRERAAEIERVAAHPEGGTVELGDEVRAVCEAGAIRFETGSEVEAAPEPVALKIPGRAQLGNWEVRAELHPGPVEPAGPDLATLDAGALAGEIEVRTWREGDRIRPLGMSGTKTLGDLFADRGVPRSERGSVPVVTVDGDVAWVAGVAVSEDFRIGDDADSVAVITVKEVE